jgi:DNA-binding GntR family transcriptional regulator
MISNYRTMQEIVTDTLRDAILNGKYPPGQRLVADELAKELGVSRMPVREALHRLEVVGLVTMVPHKGTVVSEVSEEEIIEIYHIRGVLDGLATRLAAPNLTPEDHACLNEILDQMDAAVKAKDNDRLLAINRDFHEVIWQAAHAPRLQALLQNLYDASQRFRNISLLLPGRIDQITQDHRLITQALAQNNVADAERFAIEHHEGTARRLLHTFERKKKEAE